MWAGILSDLLIIISTAINAVLSGISNFKFFLILEAIAIFTLPDIRVQNLVNSSL